MLAITVGILGVVVFVLLTVVFYVGYRRMREGREPGPSLDMVVPDAPDGTLRLSKYKTRAQAIQELRAQMFRERARFSTPGANSRPRTTMLFSVLEDEEMDNTNGTATISMPALSLSSSAAPSVENSASSAPRMLAPTAPSPYSLPDLTSQVNTISSAIDSARSNSGQLTPQNSVRSCASNSFDNSASYSGSGKRGTIVMAAVV